jgi:septal ring factor EnvC (AmiA/AmiB activator)
MKIPKTTESKPFIQFEFNEKGKMKLSTTASWWGGKNAGYSCSDGSAGNTCKPKDLKKYILAFKQKQLKRIEKEISSLQKKLEQMKTESNKFTDFIKNDK